MSRIHSKNTNPEIKLRKLLTDKKIKGYRIHSGLTGKPDIVFTKKKIAVFIDGCFWHKCKNDFVEPKTRREFWNAKIKSNVLRDKVVNRTLRKEGWKVIRFWEHEVEKRPEHCARKLEKYI